MFKSLANWFDNRTGYKALMHEALEEPIPGGAKWRYVWGSCLAFVFSLQMITGILLMTAYSPSSTQAWCPARRQSLKMAALHGKT